MEYLTIRGSDPATVGKVMHLVFCDGWEVTGKGNAGGVLEFYLRRPLHEANPYAVTGWAA